MTINKVELLPFIQTSLDKYPEIISPQMNTSKNYCGFYYRTDISSHSPVFVKSRQLSAERLKATETEFQKLLNDNLIK